MYKSSRLIRFLKAFNLKRENKRFKNPEEIQWTTI